MKIFKRQDGQVSIFIALIFQVLFLFFAMIINVGLLIHHKINLQNSVDLAAYYGATKQGEMLNAIGHINYQIRQSWKLLSWRYRQLGTAGNFSARHPYNKIGKDICANNSCTDPGGTPGEDILHGPEDKTFYEQPPFCITYIPFRPMPPDENTCKSVSNSEISQVNLFRPPPIIAGFLSFSTSIRRLTETLAQNAEKRCQLFGSWNYIMLSRFVSAFSQDQGERKLLMRTLAHSMSENPGEFLDIDGESVKDGIGETLKRNLTAPNKENVTFDIYNSLANDACGNSGGQYDPPKWLSEVKIFPTFSYADTSCDNTKVVTQSQLISTKPSMMNNTPQEFQQLINYLYQYASTNVAAPYNYSLGYEKNPWCMAYVGVVAKATPKIPFAPLGSVDLVARAYAKPFGGKIGPWYGDRWQRGIYKSADSVGHRVDNLVPPRADDADHLGDPRDPTRFANYSKYPGDLYGITSRLTLGQFGRAIFWMDSAFREQVTLNSGNALDNTGGLNLADPNNADAPNFDHWNHVGTGFTSDNGGDILAYDAKTRKDNPMRQLETVAIAPDIFDITYFSIEPDFYNMYLKRIRDNFLGKGPKKGSYPYMVRGDIGSRIGDPDLESFSVKDQMETVRKTAEKTPPFVEISNKLNYIAYESPAVKAAQVNPLLTSWLGKSLSDYSLDRGNFAKCAVKPIKDMPTTGDCVGPGRTGYSVKIVSDDYLYSSEHDIGLDSPGQIMNPPPSDFGQAIIK